MAGLHLRTGSSTEGLQKIFKIITQWSTQHLGSLFGTSEQPFSSTCLCCSISSKVWMLFSGGFLWKHKDTIGWFAIWRWGFVWILFNLIVLGELLKCTLLCINYCPTLERTQYQLQVLSVLRWMTTTWVKIIDPYCSWLCCYPWVGWFFLPKGPNCWCWWYSGKHSCLPRALTYKPLKCSLCDRIYRENSILVIRTLLTLHRPLLAPRVDISSISWVLAVSSSCV